MNHPHIEIPIMLQRRLVSIAALWVLSLALAACGDKAQIDPRTSAPLVRVAIVEGSASASRSFTGTVAARVQSDLGFRVSGKVLERLVDTGQTVRIGQPLMRIDPVDLELAAHAQQELVAAAQALAKQTAADEDRYRRMLATKVISASAYDQAKAAADTAEAHLRAAEAQSAVARNASRYAVLEADADGVVVETLVEPGQVVNAGQVVIRIARDGPREASVQLPETLRPAVGSVGQATLFGSENVVVPIKLRQISDATDRLTRTFEARYVLEGALANAPLGSTVTIQIADGHATAQRSLQVPIGALFDTGKGPGVWVINGEPSKVTWRPVAVQRLDDDDARITGQLKQGERIVALGAHLLHEGEQVRVAGQAAAVATGGGSP